MKKVLSIILSIVIMAISLSCVAVAAVTMPGDVNENGQVSATDALMVLQVVAGTKDKSFIKNVDNADLVADGQLKATDALMILQIVAGKVAPEQQKPAEPQQPTPDAPTDDNLKAQAANLFNTETAKATQVSYNWTKECKYVKNLSLPGVPASTMKNVDKLLGIGTTTGNQTNAGKNELVAMKLTKDDIKSIERWDSQQIVFILNDDSNPVVNGGSPFSNLLNDIVTKKEVEDLIKAADANATLNNFQANYSDVKVTATFSNGNPVSLTITYKLSVTVGVNNVSGDGAVETTITYADFR